MDHPYTYIFIRKDLSPAQQLVQASHAAILATNELKNPSSSSVVLIGVKDKNELYKVADRLNGYSIEFSMFHEPDFNMGHSSICTQALISQEQRKIMRKYQLYR